MIVNINQGSEAWLELRKTKITATDCPVIMGLSPFKTPERLLWQKLGILPPDEVNEAMLEGQRIEPIARALYEEATGLNMTPTVHVGIFPSNIPVHFGGIFSLIDVKEFDWAMCSTDGLSEDGSLVIEIKSGKKAWEMAQNGIIPSYYKAQIQHILWLTGAEVCDYVACNGEEIKTIGVEPDLDFRTEMIQEEYAFYQKMAKSLDEARPYILNT